MKTDWTYKGETITSQGQLPKDVFAFVYCITRQSDGKFYIGRKNLYSNRTKLLTKKELTEQALLKKPGKKPTKKKVTAESDWLKYWGSEPELKKELELNGKEGFTREIIQITFSAKSTTYQELRHQILYGCLESDNCWNKNINGKYFRKDTL